MCLPGQNKLTIGRRCVFFEMMPNSWDRSRIKILVWVIFVSSHLIVAIDLTGIRCGLFTRLGTPTSLGMLFVHPACSDWGNGCGHIASIGLGRLGIGQMRISC